MKSRRGFLRLLGFGGAAAAALTIGQEGHGQVVPKRTFKGVSSKGDMNEALKQAVAAAERSVRHPDAMATWTLKSVTGRAGGIAGFNEVVVTIEAEVR